MANTRHPRRRLASPPRAFVQEDGSVIYEVPSKAVRRLIELGVHAERAERRRSQRRRVARLSRRLNRKG